MAGGTLTPELLEQAYTHGIFPWPQADLPMLWFSPPMRGLLDFAHWKVPKSTQKYIKKGAYEVSLNRDFTAVINQCAQVPRDHESGTWILPEMIRAYEELHYLGRAISVEAWEDGALAGGLYGVLFQGVFSGESMFFKKTEASKVCLVHLVETLKTQGHHWIDIQMVTPLLEQFGGRYLARDEFLLKLKARQAEWASQNNQ